MTTIVTIDMGGTGATHAAGAREALSVPSMTDMGSAYTQANAAYTQANTARSDANTTFATINTSFGTINTNYQAAYAQANQAYSAANSANQYAFNSQITVTANTNVAAVPRPLGLNFVNTSTITVSVTNDSGNANIAFTAVGGAAYDQANAAYLQANIALISANQANVIAKDAYAQANTARTTANDAYATANTKLGTSGGSISGDLTISGNLTVQGNATTINVSNLSVNDSIILLSANSAGDAEDIGFIGHITRDSTNTHVGLIRKATENRFYLFDNYEVEPTNNTIDITGNNFRVGNIRLGTINANSFVTAAGLDVTGQANAAYGQANAAYTRANTKLDSAGGTISGNLTVTGTLTVSGNVSSINTQSISSVSNEIILNSNASGAPTLDGKLTVNRGSSSNVTLLWNETADKWGWTDNGTTYYYFEDLRQGLSTTNTTFGTINTSYQAAYAQANTAYGQANAAYGAANNRVLKAGDTMTGALNIQADAGNEQLVIKRSSNANQQLIFGYHSSNYGSIQSIEQNVAYRTLALNPFGGNVAIGTNTAAGIFTVNGYVGGTTGSVVASYNKSVVIGANNYNQSYNTGNSVLLLISDYSNDTSDNVYPIYVEDENNFVDFFLYAGNNTLGTDKRAYFGGNVGIGITSPTSPLHIFTNNNTAPIINIATSGNSLNTAVWMEDQDGNTAARAIATIDLSAGLGLFNLYGGAYTVAGANYYGSVRGASRIGLHDNIINFYTANASGVGQQTGNTVTWYQTLSSSNANFIVYTNNSTERLRVDANGNVGINTTSPGTKLEVVGMISYKPSVGNSITLGDDGTYGTSGTGRYTTLGFSANTNGGNRIFAHNTGEDGIFICAATSRAVVIRAGGSATDHSVFTSAGNFYTNGYITNIRGNASVSAPSTSDHSLGTRITLYDSTATAWYAIGIESDTMWFNSDNQYKWYVDAVQRMILDGSGNLTASGNITAQSDRKAKKNILTIENALEKVLNLRGVTYNKIQDNSAGIGVIAQEVEQIIPEVVMDGKDGFKSVAYGNMVGLLIEAIKEQQKQIEELKAKVGL
jgi:hypothetical protein